MYVFCDMVETFLDFFCQIVTELGLFIAICGSVVFVLGPNPDQGFRKKARIRNTSFESQVWFGLVCCDVLIASQLLSEFWFGSDGLVSSKS